MKTNIETIKNFLNQRENNKEKTIKVVSQLKELSKKYRDEIDFYKPEYDWIDRLPPNDRQWKMIDIKFKHLIKSCPTWLDNFKKLCKINFYCNCYLDLLDNESWATENKVFESGILNPDGIELYSRLETLEKETDSFIKELWKPFEPVKCADPNEFTNHSALLELQKKHSANFYKNYKPSDSNPNTIKYPRYRNKRDSMRLLNIPLDIEDNGDCPAEFKPESKPSKKNLSDKKAH